ncbi:glycosyl hydrolase family 28-related protein [Caballeronia sp. SBC1]|uniref:glycosyl hydrolase family 28-related protein n=1 Tax=Caballeronia sp. SBC1 TaxID=2705548 RepID=UPI001408056C|nr:glycosyl hydrolase family 28-related protein [Caballeronia sp. SBC1]
MVEATVNDLTITNATRETFTVGSGFASGASSITLAGTYGSVNNILVLFDNTIQTDCALVGQVLSFNPTVPAGVQQIVVIGGQSRTIGAPSAGTVTAPTIAPGAVTAPAIGPSAVTAPALAASAVVDASVAAGTKLYNRIINEINVCDPPFNADPTGVADSSAAFQAAINLIEASGKAGVIYVPRGYYTVSTQLAMDRSTISTNGTVSFRGAGSDATRITYTGTGNTALFYVSGNSGAGGPTTYMKFSGMTLLGTGQVGTAPFLTLLCSFFHYEDLHIEGFDYCFYGQDIDHTLFQMVTWRFNLRGFFAQQNPTPTANSTCPNQLTFVQCQWGVNSAYAVDLVMGAGNVFIGCQFEENGVAGPAGFGVQLTNSSYQGGPAAAFYGCYFESTNGIADVILVNIATNLTPPITDATYVFSGTSFNRANPASFATNSILTNFGPQSVVGQQILILTGCTFKDYNAYVPSGTRPYINFSGTQTQNKNNFISSGCVYQNALEAPTAVQNSNKCYVEIGKLANQSIPNATPTAWLIDTIATGFSWATSISSNAITIPEPGCYSISTNLVFTGAVSGVSSLSILKNGIAIGYGEATGSGIVAAHCMKTMSAGDVITVSVTQSSGSAATVAGSASANSYIVLTKMIDG